MSLKLVSPIVLSLVLPLVPVQCCWSQTQSSDSTASTQPLIDPVAAKADASKRSTEAPAFLSPTPVFVGREFEDKDASKNSGIILALGGGGCKAIAQIGVLRSLEKHHVPIDGIVGTSMGATIGALYCSGMSVDQIENLFLTGAIQKSLMTHVILKTALRPLCSIGHVVGHRPCAGLTDGHKYLCLLQKNLPPTFNDLRKPFAAVATDLTDGRTSVLNRGNLPEAILASNAVPPIFRPVLIDGKLYVDGGVRTNLPASIAHQLGPDIVVAVLVDTSIKKEPNEKFNSLKAVVGRVTDIMLAASDNQQVDNPDILIYPNADNTPLITKQVPLIEQTVAAGEAAADERMPEITKELLVKEGTRLPASSASVGEVK